MKRDIRYYVRKIVSCCIRFVARHYDFIGGKLIRADSKIIRNIGWEYYSASNKLIDIDNELYTKYFNYLDEKRAK